MKKGLRFWLTRIMLICLTPILLVGLIVILLYTPFVQKYILDKATDHIGKSYGLNIEVGHFSLSYPLDLSLQRVIVTDSLKDTLLFFKRLEADIAPLPLLNKEISIGQLDLEQAKLNTKNLLQGQLIDAEIGHIKSESNWISLIKEEIVLDVVELSDAQVKLQIDSVVSSDSIEKTNNWKILSKEIQLLHSSFTFLNAQDTMVVGTRFEQILLLDVGVDLGIKRYYANQLLLSQVDVKYDKGLGLPLTSFDPLHILLTEIDLDLDTVVYQGYDMRGVVKSFTAKEQSGIHILSMLGRIQSDESKIDISDWSLQTPQSTIRGYLQMPWDFFNDQPKNLAKTEIIASIHKNDILSVLGNQLEVLNAIGSDAKLNLHCLLQGNKNKIAVRKLESQLSKSFRLDADGVLENLNNLKGLSGKVRLDLLIESDNLLKTVVPKSFTQRVSVPNNILIKGQAAFERNEYSAELLLTERQGHVRLGGTYDPKREKYLIDLVIDSIAPVHFLPQDSIMLFTGTIKAEGQGFQIFNPSTWINCTGEVSKLVYKELVLSDFLLNGSLKQGQFNANLTSNYPYLKGNISVDGTLDKKNLNGMLIVDVDSLDLYRMHVTKKPFTNSFQIFSELKTDFQKQHRLDVTLGNWTMSLADQKVRPKTLTLLATSTEDTSRVSFYAGDLQVIFSGNSDMETLSNQLMALTKEISSQLKEDSMISLKQIQPLLPESHLQIRADRDNPVYNYLQGNNIYFDHFQLDAFTSAQSGIQADGLLLSLIKDTTKIDTIRTKIWQDSTKLNYYADVIKNKFRMQEPFRAGIKGDFQYKKGEVELSYLNGRGETGLYLGVRMEKQSDGLDIRLFPENPIIAFIPFQLNEDNFLKIKNKKNILANIRLQGQENASLWFHSLPEEGVMQELSTEIRQIDLNKITKGFDNLLPMQGLANVSLRYVPIDDTYMLAAEATVDNLKYQGEEVGELLLNGIYLPLGNDEHQIDMHFFHERKEVSTFSALYKSDENEKINGFFEINQLPLSMFNPFLIGISNLKGDLNSQMKLEGTLKKPIMEGTFQLDTTSIYFVPTGSYYQLSGQKINIENSQFKFDKFQINALGKANPFLINGIVDFRKSLTGFADLQLSAKNMEVFNSRKNKDNVLYGKMYVDLNSTIKGPLNSLYMRGYLHLLGNSNMTYIMKESPLVVKDRLKNLVTFSYFSDTIPRRNRIGLSRTAGEVSSIGGMDMLLIIQVDPVVKLSIDMDEDESNHIELQGGGNLTFQYTPQGDMLLTGRYTLSEGLVKYSLPIVTNKNLKIQNNSYLEWDGDPFNPFLNVKATERIRATISTDAKSSRPVNFEAGIVLKQQFTNMKLQFTLDALDDAGVQNQLMSIGEEARSKQAVGMLLTGVYLPEQGVGSTRVDMGGVLTNFLKGEINDITGSLLKGADLSIGMEGGVGRGADYSFRFSKGFYNDRLNVVIGGSVSTTNESRENNNAFINDASIEYRLDTGGSRYAKLFYNREYESLLEGQIAKYGGGFVFRRKMRHLSELFRWGNKQKTKLNQETSEK